MASEIKDGLDLTWQGATLPRVSPGDYEAACVDWQGPDWVRTFRRWSLRLELCLLAENTCVSAFFNMGNDPARPRIGRRSRYYAAWTQANGEPPRRGQQMTPETFKDAGLLYLVRVADAVRDGKDEVKPDALVYSRITEILNVRRL